MTNDNYTKDTAIVQIEKIQLIDFRQDIGFINE